MPHCFLGAVFLHDSAYQHVPRACAVPIDDNGRCVLAKKVGSSETVSSKGKGKEQPLKWHCSSECTAVTEAEVAAIVHLKQEFKKPMKKL